MAEWIAENRIGKNSNYIEKRKGNLHPFYRDALLSPYKLLSSQVKNNSPESINFFRFLSLIFCF